MVDTLQELKPDILILLGDRDEILAAAIAALHLRIPVAHIHGGDQGDQGYSIDDYNRHAVTKLAAIHFPATKRSARRILALGEEEWRVHVVGAPGLDGINEIASSKEELEKACGIDTSKPLFLLVQHPVPPYGKNAGEQMRKTLEAVKKLEIQTIALYPNADAGGGEMIEVLKEYENLQFMHVFQSLPREQYLGLMKIAAVMIGNSSSGSIEAPSFKLPVVNIGIRESSRENGGNKIFVKHDKNEIVKAIKKAINDCEFRKKIENCKSPYGDGRASEKIVSLLSTIKIDKKLLQKKFDIK